MIVLLLLPFLFSNFVEKWYLPQGTQFRAGRVCIGDTDHDGHNELIFSTYGVSFKIFSTFLTRGRWIRFSVRGTGFLIFGI
jgi:hypothetical protein